MWEYLNAIFFSTKEGTDEVFNESEESEESDVNESRDYPYKVTLTSKHPGNLRHFISKIESKCAKYEITMTPKYKKTCNDDNIPCECKVHNE